MHYTTLFELGAKTWTQDTTFHTHSISNGRNLFGWYRSSYANFKFLHKSRKLHSIKLLQCKSKTGNDSQLISPRCESLPLYTRQHYNLSLSKSEIPNQNYDQ